MNSLFSPVGTGQRARGGISIFPYWDVGTAAGLRYKNGTEPVPLGLF